MIYPSLPVCVGHYWLLLIRVPSTEQLCCLSKQTSSPHYHAYVHISINWGSDQDWLHCPLVVLYSSVISAFTYVQVYQGPPLRRSQWPRPAPGCQRITASSCCWAMAGVWRPETSRGQLQSGERWREASSRDAKLSILNVLKFLQHSGLLYRQELSLHMQFSELNITQLCRHLVTICDYLFKLNFNILLIVCCLLSL